MTELNGEKCDRCGIVGDDRRTLWMACLYVMHELGIPFTQRAIHGWPVGFQGMSNDKFPRPKWGYPDKQDNEPRDVPFYTLRVCKGCRSEWLIAIRAWFQRPPGQDHIYNNDANDQAAPYAELLARAESLRTGLTALQQAIDDTVARCRKQLQEAEEDHLKK